MKLPIALLLLSVTWILAASSSALDELAIKAATEPKSTAFADYLKATADLPPQEKLAALWKATLLANDVPQKQAILAQAETISLPGTRMLVSAFHHDEALQGDVNKATKALNILMPPPKKDEEDKGAATDPYKTPSLTETWADALDIFGRWKADGDTLDIVAYPEKSFQGVLTDAKGARVKLLGLLEGDKLHLYGVGVKGYASKNETVLSIGSPSENKITFARATVGKTAAFPKPANGKMLFDGSNLDAFEKNSWKILPDGVLQSSPRTGNLKTKEGFSDARLFLEFRVPLNPECVGQRRSNSGVILMGAYEVQLLDSFGLEPKANDCGAIYSVSAPQMNMAAPPLEWQSYLIEFHAPRFDDAGKKTANARISVWHNGELIQDNVEVPRLTGASPGKPSPRPEPSKPESLVIQDHGNTLQYRNIWIAPL